MTTHSARWPGFGTLGAAAPGARNAALGMLESVAFGVGVWLVLTAVHGRREDAPILVAAGPASAAFAGALFFIGRMWVGLGAFATLWPANLSESAALGMLVAIAGCGLGWGWELIAAYVPVTDSVVHGALRAVWTAAALVAPYVFASDRAAPGT